MRYVTEHRASKIGNSAIHLCIYEIKEDYYVCRYRSSIRYGILPVIGHIDISNECALWCMCSHIESYINLVTIIGTCTHIPYIIFP